MREINKLDFKATGAHAHECESSEDCDRCLAALRARSLEFDLTPLEWADVIVFRRYYNTGMKCAERSCRLITHDLNEARAHPHRMQPQDRVTRDMWPTFRDHMRGAAIVYETDDNHFEIKRWNGYYDEVVKERDLITDMARRADLVTVSTPDLVSTYGRFNRNIRVVRNAIDPDLYVPDAPRPDGDLPRLVYYGSLARLRDYAGRFAFGNKADGGGHAYRAVEDNKHLLTRVFLGADDDRAAGALPRLFDEVHPHIDGIAAFAKGLSNIHGDIGIAPLGGDDFDKSKSELHWLEYALTGMAFIGERFSGGGPYAVVNHGVDGLLVRGRQEWYDAVRSLATSPDLRAQLAGSARERVLAEYDYRDRAVEWADAFRWAYDNQRDYKDKAA